ncbi:hypothetical protein D3C79_616280 [compost metagenome]
MLAQRWRQETRTVRQGGSIAINKLPTCRGLPSAVPTKVTCLVFTPRGFQSHAAKLLLATQVQARVVSFIGIGKGTVGRSQALLLEIGTGGNATVLESIGIAPLQVTLIHIIQRSADAITAILAAVVVIFLFLIAARQLRRESPRQETQPHIIGVAIQAVFIITVLRAVRYTADIVVRVIGITITPHEA